MEFFPYPKERKGQELIIEYLERVLKDKNNLLINAPTGIGKTAAVIAPSLNYSMSNKKKLFFLTSRQTQHTIAISTVKAIAKKIKKDIKCVDLSGRQSLCLVEGIEKLFSNEFAEYCRYSRKNGSCLFYKNTINHDALTKKAEEIARRVENGELSSSFDVKEACRKSELCPYEILMRLAQNADIVIADYYYFFNPKIRVGFLNNMKIELKDSIVIVDEAHNLPQRIREVMSSRLTSNMTRRAIEEARKYKFEDCIPALAEIQDFLIEEAREIGSNEEKLIKTERFIERLNLFMPYDDIIELLDDAGESIRTKARHSYIGSIADFLEMWKGNDEGFARIISIEHKKSNESISLQYRCLDPSIASKEIADESHSLILMSATLFPPEMYAKVLGMDNAEMLSLKSPFPKKNRLSLIVPKATTKYTKRSDDEFKKIASILHDISSFVKGNMAVFFPSYYILEKVKGFFEAIQSNKSDTNKRKLILTEFGAMGKSDKNNLLERFKESKDKGGILFGVLGGSFAEGIDLPGEYLNCVVNVGIPFPKPDLETKELINYYNKKFGNGLFYGYIFPTMNKLIQAAGRCIRTENDKGVIIFIDERFIWPQYMKCFPPDWDLVISKDLKKEIKDFFS